TPDLLPWLLRDHLLDRTLAAVEHAREIDAHHLLPLRELCFEQRRAGVGGGIVDHDVEPAVAVDRTADERVDFLPAPDVGPVKGRRAARPGDGRDCRLAAFDGLLADISDHDARPFAGETDGDRATDAGAGSGDDSNLSREQTRHRVR